MDISNRIKAIAEMIDFSDKHVYDLGCDHALLDIYLATKYSNLMCTASDINEKALNNAKKNIKKYSLDDRISTIISDGLDKLDIQNGSSIVISGMGTSTIIHILQNHKMYFANKIIIQSNNDLYKLRKFMISKGFIISDEKIVLERKKYYVIICFKQGYKKYRKYDLVLGPKIIRDNLEINKKYLIYLKNKEILKLKNIPKKHLFLRIKCRIKLKKIMNYI